MFHKTSGNMKGAGSVSGRRKETTLGQYIERKEKAYKEKLTFEQWMLAYLGTPFEDCDFNLTDYDLKSAWKAAQENL